MRSLSKDKAQKVHYLEQAELVRKYDEIHLKPKKEDVKLLEKMLSEVLSVLTPQANNLKIERIMPFGSYNNDSLRNYKFELDLLAVINSKSSNKQIIENIKEILSQEKSRLKQNYQFLVLQDKRKQDVLQISLGEKVQKPLDFHQ